MKSTSTSSLSEMVRNIEAIVILWSKTFRQKKTNLTAKLEIHDHYYVLSIWKSICIFSLYYYMYIIIMQNENEITFCMKEALCTTRRFYSKVKSILIVYRDVKDFVYFILTWQVQYKKHKKVRCWIKVVSSCNGYFDLGKFKLNPRLNIVYYDKINPLEIYLYIGTYCVFQYYLKIYLFVSVMIQSLKNIKCLP